MIKHGLLFCVKYPELISASTLFIHFAIKKDAHFPVFPAAASFSWRGPVSVFPVTQKHPSAPPIRPIGGPLHPLGSVSVGTRWLQACTQETVPILSPGDRRWRHPPTAGPAGAGAPWERERLQERGWQWVSMSGGQLGDVFFVVVVVVVIVQFLILLPGFRSQAPDLSPKVI